MRIDMRALVPTLSLALLAAAGSTSQASSPCAQPGEWYHTASGEALSSRAALAEIAEADFILLGERHDNPDHHRWQLHTLAALHARSGIGAVGLEMLPRSEQAALTDWRRGELAFQGFLEAVSWQDAWGFDAELYRPLLEFMRLHRLPGQALNVSREAVRAVRQEGWASLGPAEREGVGEPAEPTPSYRKELESSLKHHPGVELDGDNGADRLIAAQVYWDRAMAEALAEAYEAEGGPVVGIVGRGHAQRGAIPHQLADLGHDAVQVLLPLDAEAPCPEAGKADYRFIVDAGRSEADPPRMGIAMAVQDGHLVVRDILPETPAEASDLEAGDRIIEAAGETVAGPRQMQRIVERQAPGTWLPLRVERDGERREIIVRFPPE